MASSSGDRSRVGWATPSWLVDFANEIRGALHINDFEDELEAAARKQKESLSKGMSKIGSPFKPITDALNKK